MSDSECEVAAFIKHCLHPTGVPLTVKCAATSRTEGVRQCVELWSEDPGHTLEIRQPARHLASAPHLAFELLNILGTSLCLLAQGVCSCLCRMLGRAQLIYHRLEAVALAMRLLSRTARIWCSHSVTTVNRVSTSSYCAVQLVQTTAEQSQFCFRRVDS